MKVVSTRGNAPAVGIADAIAAGLAPDGGLYMPEHWPSFTPADFEGCNSTAEVATRMLAPFFEGDVLAPELARICAEAFAVEPPLRGFGPDGDYVLELFHGPTAAFKDYGAAFLAGCLSALPRDAGTPLTIVVATSGDTGAAVAGAFHGRAGIRVAILYPDGRVSPRQAHQLGCFGDNIRAFRVDGSFDDCQRMAKTVLSDAAFRAEVPLGSANSISLGRLFPQAAYYARASLQHWRATGRRLNFVVPTGNLGNALACLLARRMGLPIGEIVLASNANVVLPDFFAGGDYAPQSSIATLANAMDVGAPSNFERLQWLYPDAAELRTVLRAEAVDDDAIRAAILRTRDQRGYVACPHTACAAEVLDRLRARDEAGDWAAVATAHPAKFPEVVEPVLGEEVPLPPALQAMLDRPSHAQSLADDTDALRALLRKP
jgi:threonine synthase